MVFLEETRVIWHVIGLAFLGVQTFTYAKFMGVIYALKHAWREGFQRLW